MGGQTSYSLYIPAVSYPGQLADMDQVKDVLSAINFAAAMNYGIMGVTDESNTGGFDALAVKAPAASTDITVVGAQLGVVLADQGRAQNPAVATAQYPIQSAVSLLRQGRVWVNAETAMADGANPFIRYTVNGALFVGNFRNDADTAKAAQMAAGQAVVRGTTLAAGYAVIELAIV